MARKVAPCGTWTAYKRHLRNDEQPCEECVEASREYNREQRERESGANALNTELAKGNDADVETVRHLVAYGEFEDVEVPTFEGQLEAARWRLRRVRAALLVAGPRDVAPLAKAEQEIVHEISGLAQPKEQEKKVSKLDELADKRAARIAASAG